MSVVGGEVALGGTGQMDGGAWGWGRKQKTSSDSQRKGYLTDFMEEQETHYQHWSQMQGKI